MVVFRILVLDSSVAKCFLVSVAHLPNMGLLANLLKLLLGQTASNLNPSLNQNTTNGNSTLGTLNATHLPAFLTSNPLPYGYPWGQDSQTNTNPYTASPFTNVVRKYNFTISRGVLAPDGYQRSMLLINGSYPGPLIECKYIYTENECCSSPL